MGLHLKSIRVNRVQPRKFYKPTKFGGAFTPIFFNVDPIVIPEVFSVSAKKATLSIRGGVSISIDALRSTTDFRGSGGHFLNYFDNQAKKASLVITGIHGSLGTFDKEAKKSTLVITGFDNTTGTLLITARRSTLELHGYDILADIFECISLCLDNSANTYYNNFLFNSFAPFGDEILAANSSGIYLLTGADDAGTDITASLETAQTNFNMDELKTVHDIYIAYEGGPIRVNVKNIDNNKNVQELEVTSEMKTRRSVIGKGIEHRLWGIKLVNVDGASVYIDNIELRPFTLSGRI